MANKEELQLIISAKDEASKTLNKVNNEVSGITSNLKKAGIAIAAAGTAFGIFGKKAISAAADFQQTQIAFTTMLGSAEEANELLKDLGAFAARTPFELQDVEKNTRLLMAMGIEVDNIIPTMKALGDVSAGLSVPLEQIAFNYGQVKAQTKLTGVELRDFARAGVPIIAELATNLGVTEAAIKEMVSAGQIGFAEVEQAFITMTSEGGRFNDLMDAQSRTFNGALSNMKDQITLWMREAGEPYLEMGTRIITKISDTIAAMRENGSMVETLKKKFGDFLEELNIKIGIITFFKEAWDNVVLVFRENLLPVLTEFWEVITPLTPFLNELAKVFGVILAGALMAIVKILEVSLIVAMELLKSIISAVTDGVNFLKKGFDSFTDGLARTINIVQDLINKLKELKEATTGKIGGAIDTVKESYANFIPNVKEVFGGMRAEGGPVDVGKSYMVGENGPEMFTPSRSGRIIPNGSSNTSVTVNITGTFMSEDAAAQMGDIMVNRLAGAGLSL